MDKDGLKTEAIQAKLELKEHLPEWLPMFGCKVRVFYHGMPIQCKRCWESGHVGKDCTGEDINWKAFTKKLFATGNFKREMFGFWLEEPPKPQQQTHEEELNELKSLLSKSTDLRKLVNYLKKDKANPAQDRPKTKAKPKGRLKGPQGKKKAE